MPRTGTDKSNIAFDQQGDEMLITVWHKPPGFSLFNHATHRLKADEVEKLQQECVKVLEAAALAAKGGA